MTPLLLLFRSLMKLTATIAHQIIERTIKIIKHAINVMDSNGRIMGSSDPSRVGNFHEGALLAIHDNRVIEIDEAMALKLKGVKPGINLPIIFEDNIVGVVGVSGEPSVVHNYGELVKMTAELIIEQAALMSQIQWNKRHKEELVSQLIQGEKINENQVLSIAEHLGLNLKTPRVAAIVKITEKPNTILSLDHLKELVYLLENPERDNIVGIVSVSMSEVVVLKPIKLIDSTWSKELEYKKAEKLIRRLTKQGKFTAQIAIGDYFPSLQGLSKSYQTAKATMDAANKFFNRNNSNNIFFYQDYILPVILSGLKDDPWRYGQLQQPVIKLKQNDPKGVLLKTLKVFFEQNCDLTQTCENLHIHRNTLRYRLDKINQETEFNTSNINDLIMLYISVIAIS